MTMPVYFQVMRFGTDFSAKQTPITFDTVMLNTGNAMDINSGIFTAPRKGTYTFAFAAVVNFSGSDGYMTLQVLVNGQVFNIGHAHGDQHDQTSVHTTLKLKAGDQVWTIISDADSVILRQWMHFTGWQLQEELTF